jgi:hypothetical protein
MWKNGKYMAKKKKQKISVQIRLSDQYFTTGNIFRFPFPSSDQIRAVDSIRMNIIQ